MTPQEIERWAGQVIEQVCAGKFQEDSRVELKRAWPEDTHGIARRLAAHANAARGDSILWVIGVDEKAREVAGVPARDPASWWPAVCKAFDGEPPAIVQVTMRVAGENVVALYFDTMAAPYVVTNRAHGSSGENVRWEVPWRAAADTRSATRNELLRILVPRARTPRLEVLDGKLTHRMREDGGVLWSLDVQLYIVSRTPEPLILPRHRVSGTLQLPGFTPLALTEFALPQPLKPMAEGAALGTHIYGKREALSPLVRATASETIVEYAGVVWLHANAVSIRDLAQCEADALVTLTFLPTSSEIPAVLHVEFQRARLGDVEWKPVKESPP